MTEIMQALHVAMLVSDVQRAAAFYHGVLGLEPIARSLKFPGQWYQVGAFQIHLMEVPGWQAPLPRPEKWGRNPHLALQVTDLAAMKQRLTEQGYPVQMSASGRAALFTQDPDGNVLELGQG
jgi:glyoxylase I family protein